MNTFDGELLFGNDEKVVEDVEETVTPSTTLPVISNDERDLRVAEFTHFLIHNSELQGLLNYTEIPEKGHSEKFMSLLNHMGYFFPNPETLLDVLLSSPLGCSDWLQSRLKRPDKKLYSEINKAIATQTNSYNPYQDFPVILTQDDIAIECGNRFFYSNARYIASFNKWYFWDGVRWLVDKRAIHYSYIGNHLRDISNELKKWIKAQKNILNEKEFKTKSKWVEAEYKNLRSAPFRQNIDTLLKTSTHCSVNHEIFDANNLQLGTPNGVYNLQTCILHPSHQDYYISKLTGCVVMKGKPTLWLKFLSTIFSGNQELINFIQRLCGYCLTGLTVEEKIFFFYGTGANGKSKFLEILFFVLGDYARKAPANLLLETRNQEHATGLAGLKGARLVVCSELPSGATWNDQVLKDITGGDTISARLMRQDFFDFKPQFTPIIAGNHQPRLKNIDESMIRRMVMIDFGVTIPKEKRDPHLGDKLKSEAGQILKWCIDGAYHYFQQGLNIPQVVLDTSSDYIKNEDVIGEFIESRLIKIGGRTEFNLIFQQYTLWMNLQGYNFPMTERNLKKVFKDRDIKVIRSNSIYYINGFGINYVPQKQA